MSLQSETAQDPVAGAPPLALTARAAKRILEVAAAEGKPLMLRLAVSGGGCSGFQYGFTLDDSRLGDDLAIERDGAILLVDEVSMPYLMGSEVDFVDNLMGQSFQVTNPNAKSSCGCGTSFSV
jgi:iron-sulfur cluster assembly accessory protein